MVAVEVVVVVLEVVVVEDEVVVVVEDGLAGDPVAQILLGAPSPAPSQIKVGRYTQTNPGLLAQSASVVHPLQLKPFKHMPVPSETLAAQRERKQKEFSAAEQVVG